MHFTQRSVPQVIDTLSAATTHGVDIQLRVLQTVLSLLTNCAEIHGDDLGKVGNWSRLSLRAKTDAASP